MGGFNLWLVCKVLQTIKSVWGTESVMRVQKRTSIGGGELGPVEGVDCVGSLKVVGTPHLL